MLGSTARLERGCGREKVTGLERERELWGEKEIERKDTREDERGREKIYGVGRGEREGRRNT